MLYICIINNAIIHNQSKSKMATQKVKFIKEETEKGFINPMSGRRISTRIYVINSEGKKGCLPGETTPYCPLGGRKALLEVLDVLIWI
jgi:hypothetical protein